MTGQAAKCLPSNKLADVEIEMAAPLERPFFIAMLTQFSRDE